MKSARVAVSGALLLLAGGCGSRGPEIASSAPSPPRAEARYAALPDTVICVVDRTTDRGLRDLPAKQESGKVVLLVEDQIRPIEELHPVSLIAGYAGRESWFSRAQPITLQSRRYLKYAGERRIPTDKLKRFGEYQGIPLFGDPATSGVPTAVYVPVRVGCVFQAYVRDDLYRAG